MDYSGDIAFGGEYTPQQSYTQEDMFSSGVLETEDDIFGNIM